MRGVVMYAPGDVRVEDRPDPTILKPTDAIIRLSAACICGSDLWPYWGVEAIDGPRPMGHEYVGIVEEVGSAVTTIQPGQFVVGSFFASDNTCEICRSGYQPSCPHKEAFGPTGAAQAGADAGASSPTVPWSRPPRFRRGSGAALPATSEVLGTGWFAAVAAEAGPGKTDVVVGDGASGCSGSGRERARRGTDHRDEPQ
jgi:threonine dehydrogenase-like Zn-dependent dehydrogenase